MNAMSRIRDLWASIRPRTRRGTRLAAVAILGGAVALSVGLFAGAAMAWSPYLTFSLDRESDARSWAAIDPTFAGAGLCVTCHETEARRASAAAHAGISCESCHWALEAHVLAGEEDAAETVTIAVPGDDVCSRCHLQAIGRPAGFREIVLSDHYVPVCLQCHDPHTGLANRPPIVEHTLDHLPPCLTCHGPEGFKARNQRHPAGSTDDQPCLDCHAPGRGPNDAQVSR